MTQEEKQLLLKDLCARLPYGVKIQDNSKKPKKLYAVYPYCAKVSIANNIFLDDRYLDIQEIKPYLRPMSSMTEEEDKEFALLQVNTHNSGFLYAIDAANMINWLNAHHFDYRGLIEKGLALEAAEGMYKI